jgi:hypothetical protein
MPKDFRQRHPELRWDFETWDQGGQITSMKIVLPLGGDQSQIAEAVVSGARRGQRP